MKRRNSNIVPRETQASAVTARLLAILEEFRKTPLPVGDLGAELLNRLEIVYAIRELAREKAKEVLLQDGTAIPGWRAEQTRGARELIQDLRAVHAAVEEVFPTFGFDQFLAGCKTSFAGLQRAICARFPDLDPKLIARELDRALSAQIRIGEPVTRLIRTKPARIPLPPKTWEPPTPPPRGK
jgi:hypothetical protein